MGRRVRIASVTVQVHAFVDDTDTDTLTPLPVQPITYPAGDWALFDLDRIRDAVQRQIDTEQATAPDNTANR
jgi:hypothetical protein